MTMHVFTYSKLMCKIIYKPSIASSRDFVAMDFTLALKNCFLKSVATLKMLDIQIQVAKCFSERYLPKFSTSETVL